MYNIANFKKLRKKLAHLPPEHFDMDYFRLQDTCGTVACMAGWASTLSGVPMRLRADGTENDFMHVDGLSVPEQGAKFLGIPYRPNVHIDRENDGDIEELPLASCISLFNIGQWPLGYQERVNQLTNEERTRREAEGSFNAEDYILIQRDSERKMAIALIDYIIVHDELPSDEFDPQTPIPPRSRRK